MVYIGLRVPSGKASVRIVALLWQGAPSGGQVHLQSISTSSCCGFRWCWISLLAECGPSLGGQWCSNLTFVGRGWCWSNYLHFTI